MKRSPSPSRLILVLCAVMLGLTVLMAQLAVLRELPTLTASWQGQVHGVRERAHGALARLSSAVPGAGLQTRWEQARARLPSPPTASSPEREVRAAWQRAQRAGAYHFTTRIVQTTHPAPTIANVGKSSRVQTLYLEGDADLSPHAPVAGRRPGDQRR